MSNSISIALNVVLDAIVNAKSLDERVDLINEVRGKIHELSPFKNEPVDFVRWVKNENVVANDYNPNKVAPPEMQLLEVSIINDGYTQPIVTFPNEDKIEVVDGFHRSRVGKESILVKGRVNGFLPVVSIRKEKQDKSERIASTIRHNRARGKHQVNAMSEIVIELKNRNWNNKRIAAELGMDEDEILRLCQVSGLENLFKDNDFSRAWVTEGSADEDFEHITDEVDEMNLVRIPNEDDPDRIFHTFEKWECVRYDFFETTHKTLSPTQCEYKYLELLGNIEEFRSVLQKLTSEWPFSCEHNLTNKAMNRIAWLGQAALAYKYKIPSRFSTGWSLLSESQKEAANEVALDALNAWLKKKGLPIVTMEEAVSFDRQVELY